MLLIIDLEETKTWLRIDGDNENDTINMLINAAETYLFNATGLYFDNKNNLAKLFCLVLVTDWYENRELIGEKTSDKVRFTVQSMLGQLQHGYAPPEAPTILTATPGDGVAFLSWATSTDGNAAGYHVYQDRAKITTEPIVETTYQVTGLINGTTYIFQVSSVDSAGNESELSEPVMVTPTA